MCGCQRSGRVLGCTRGLGATHLAWLNHACSFSSLMKHWLFLSESHLLSTYLLCQSSEKLALEKLPGHQPGKSGFMSSLSLLTLVPARSTFVAAPQSPHQRSLLCLPLNREKRAVEEGNERRWWGREAAKEMDRKKWDQCVIPAYRMGMWRKGRDRAFVRAREALRQLAGRHGKLYWQGLQSWKMWKGCYEQGDKIVFILENGKHKR